MKIYENIILGQIVKRIWNVEATLYHYVSNSREPQMHCKIEFHVTRP